MLVFFVVICADIITLLRSTRSTSSWVRVGEGELLKFIYIPRESRSPKGIPTAPIGPALHFCGMSHAVALARVNWATPGNLGRCGGFSPKGEGMEWRVGSCWGGNPPWLLTTPRYLSPPIGALADRDEITKKYAQKEAETGQ